MGCGAPLPLVLAVPIGARTGVASLRTHTAPRRGSSGTTLRAAQRGSATVPWRRPSRRPCGQLDALTSLAGDQAAPGDRAGTAQSSSISGEERLDVGGELV